jgi:hypothetical protein
MDLLLALTPVPTAHSKLAHPKEHLHSQRRSVHCSLEKTACVSVDSDQLP